MTLGGTENMAMSAVEGAIGLSIGLLITDLLVLLRCGLDVEKGKDRRPPASASCDGCQLGIPPPPPLYLTGGRTPVIHSLQSL